MKFIKIITIIAVLIILSIFLMIATRKNQRYCEKISCNTNLKQIGLGIMMYADENNDYFPLGDNTNGLKKLIPLLNQTKVLICPVDKKRIAGKKNVLQENNSSYIYLGAEYKASEIRYPLITIIAFDKPNNHDSYVNVLYMDGHVRKIKMNGKQTCESILKTAYKDDFPDPIRKLQLEKVKAMDKKFSWKPKRERFEIIRWIFGSILILFGGYVSSFAITRTVINLRNQRRGIDRHISAMPFGSLFFIGGWIITPLPWSWFILLIVILDFDTLFLPFGLIYAYIHTSDKEEENTEYQG